MELWERGHQQPLLNMHRAVFESAPLPTLPGLGATTIHGKGILYARVTFAFPQDGPWRDVLQAGVHLDQTDYADIPHAGAIIERGQPVLTLFASAATAADCLASLQEKAQALDRRLWG